jgi:hydroxyethylthiazole kinase-like uncharacterized protein yjeF
VKVLSAAQMREVDRRTMDLGIPGLILMENAGCRFVEEIEKRFSPLAAHRILVVCGKGNNGGDGLVIARQLAVRIHPRALDVVLAEEPESFEGDAAENWKMMRALGIATAREITPEMRTATLVVDALLGTGLKGPARGRALELIQQINAWFPAASIVSVDVPSGLHPDGESVRAALTVTFAAPKIEMIVPPTCDRVGELVVAPIGMPAALLEENDEYWLNLTEPREFSALLAKRASAAHKGNYGHVLVIGGARGKGGAAAMSGMAALRAGAGLVTVAAGERERSIITALAPELMTQSYAEDHANKGVLALGPGLGHDAALVTFARRLFADVPKPVVVDADGLNALAGTDFHASDALRVLTPHPGEMARLTGLSPSAIQADRVGVARTFARERGCALVLKGQRTVIAFPSGDVWINPTGTPAMATAGSGDILTGIIAGLLAQFPGEPGLAVIAAVWLHGRAGEIGAAQLGEHSLVATDLLRFLPEAWSDARRLSHAL